MLDISFKEINEQSEIWCEYIPKTEKPSGARGRPKVIGVTFKMGMKENYKIKKETAKKIIAYKNRFIKNNEETN